MDTKLNRLSYNTNLDASIVRLLQSRTVAATIKMNPNLPWAAPLSVLFKAGHHVPTRNHSQEYLDPCIEWHKLSPRI